MEKSCDKKTTNISQEYGDMSNTVIHLICKTFENHQIIKEIKKNLIEKHTDNKYLVSNFHLVSVLNIFSKTYEKVLKNAC